MAGSGVCNVGWQAHCVRMSSTIQTGRLCRRLSLPATLLPLRGSRNKSACFAEAGQRVSFGSSVHTDLLLREFQAVSFEQYMEDKDHVFNALFPDTNRRQKLNNDEWRIFMLPLEFFFLSVRPVVDMRVTLKESANPNISSIGNVFKLLSLEATRWELRGLDYEVNPSEFDLGIVGTLYPEKGPCGQLRLKGHMELTVDLMIPPALGFIPLPIIESVGTVLLSQVLDNMKDRVNIRLLKDYQEYAQLQHARLSSA